MHIVWKENGRLNIVNGTAAVHSFGSIKIWKSIGMVRPLALITIKMVVLVNNFECYKCFNLLLGLLREIIKLL